MAHMEMSNYFDPTLVVPNPLSFHNERSSWETNRYGSPEDGYFTESEEEVLYNLDEVAMAALPLRLQDNMRELHFERVQRLKREKSNTLFYKPTCHEASPAIWYQDSIATMGASQDAGRGGLPSSSSKKTDWYLWQSMREMDYRRHMAHDAMVTAGLYSHSSSARFNLFSRYSTSTEEDIEARSIRSKYTPQSTGAKTRPCVVHSVEDMETTHEEPNVHERQFRRRGSSMISAMRWHVRRSIQKMSRVFKKQPSYQGHTGTYEAFVAT